MTKPRIRNRTTASAKPRRSRAAKPAQRTQPVLEPEPDEPIAQAPEPDELVAQAPEPDEPVAQAAKPAEPADSTPYFGGFGVPESFGVNFDRIKNTYGTLEHDDTPTMGKLLDGVEAVDALRRYCDYTKQTTIDYAHHVRALRKQHYRLGKDVEKALNEPLPAKTPKKRARSHRSSTAESGTRRVSRSDDESDFTVNEADNDNEDGDGGGGGSGDGKISNGSGGGKSRTVGSSATARRRESAQQRTRANGVIFRRIEASKRNVNLANDSLKRIMRNFQEKYRKIDWAVKQLDRRYKDLQRETQNYQRHLLSEALTQMKCDPNFGTRGIMLTNPFQLALERANNRKSSAPVLSVIGSGGMSPESTAISGGVGGAAGTGMASTPVTSAKQPAKRQRTASK